MSDSVDDARPRDHDAADAAAIGESNGFVFDEPTDPDPRHLWFEIVVDPEPAAGDDAHDSQDTVCGPLPSDLY